MTQSLAERRHCLLCNKDDSRKGIWVHVSSDFFCFCLHDKDRPSCSPLPLKRNDDFYAYAYALEETLQCDLFY